MNPQEESHDEEQLASLMANLNQDAPPPDAAFLDRLREQSTEAFLALSPDHTQRSTTRRWTSSSAIRALVFPLAAAILLGIIWFSSSFSKRDPDLAVILDNVANAQSFHARLICDSKTTDVWASQPGQLRLDEPDGTHEIAVGPNVWLVNGPANKVTKRDSPYSVDVKRPGLQITRLLGLQEGKNSWRDLSAARPVERAERDGVECLRYQMVSADLKEVVIQLEAWVDASTHLLQSLEVKGLRNGRMETIAEFIALSYNEPVAQEKFVVSDTLTEDGRIGKVTDSQGIVTVKPVMHSRWTPVQKNLIMKPGNWLRTDIRGANAVNVRLVKQTQVILGPGTLAELLKPDQIRLYEGELELTVPADAKLELLGPNEQKIAVNGTQRFEIAKEKLVQVIREPLWLKGFKGATNNESIGSLIAKVEGRNEPLTVGYHKVTVDIRDQIARTVIEESFVNHTNATLEGVFYFPLPQDASISGFGMWIGDHLVEADIVEKQRAREIYEIIKSERRDPGLLEWSGGNIFTARVFPIFAHSEKRIKISYTQVLLLKGNRYRYSYSLQSEMLKLHPLRELAIDVMVNSTVPLKNVTSPTHTARTDRTEHSGHIEFTAQEYTPTRDFEVVVEVDGRQSDVAMIPHRRGDDGYFMLQVMPPASQGDWDRSILPDGEPLQFLLLADTSASIDRSQREIQAVFLASLLSSLTTRDTFNLAACDVDCDWVFEKPVPADEKSIQMARQFLAKRSSLGWTDLDKAFASALKQSGPRTHIIYVGDGIVTTGDADPVAFAKRLTRLYEGNAGTFHSVVLGNSFEPAALRARTAPLVSP